MAGFDRADVERLLAVVRGVPRGGTLEERLGGLAESVAELLLCEGWTVVLVPGGPALPSRAVSRHYLTSELLAYAAHYRHVDPMGYGIVEATGAPLQLSEALAGRPFGRDAFTGEYLPRLDIQHILGVAHRMPDGSRLAVAFHRERRRPDFGARERELLRLVSADLGRAAHLALLEEERDELGRAPSARRGVLLLDDSGGLVYADHTGLELADALRGERSLADLGRRLVRLRGGDAQRWPAAGLGWLKVRASSFVDQGRRRVLVVLERPPRSSDEALAAAADRLGLTQREREVAALVARGLANAEIAWQLGIAAPTVSAHLRSAFRKARVGNRVELVRALLDVEG